MGYIHCCGAKRKSKSYTLVPEKNYLLVELDYLIKCPACGHTVVQITRIDFNHDISFVRKVNEKAKKLFENLQNSILCKKEPEYKSIKVFSKFYLNYNEFGVKKKCYSNLSSLKIGLFENNPYINQS
ncbi:MAG TPA: hypothetical protein PLG15_00095 [Candidatus Gastranaerophilaceae bacterium]|nr:hypothetical protein [Candidatus Gastranaerophilaceae bacterium]HPT40767.1 hypothetical protein [Candidatus Gastranaerophilaceae bacterium]